MFFLPLYHKEKEKKKLLDILLICGIIPLADAGIAHPVERHLAKVEVASSSLVARSIQNLLRLQWVFFIRGYGGIGRHAGFRFQWATVQVQVLLPAPEKGHPKGCPFSGAGNRVTGFCPRAARRQRRKPLMRLPSPFKEFKSCYYCSTATKKWPPFLVRVTEQLGSARAQRGGSDSDADFWSLS